MVNTRPLGQMLKGFYKDLTGEDPEERKANPGQLKPLEDLLSEDEGEMETPTQPPQDQPSPVSRPNFDFLREVEGFETEAYIPEDDDGTPIDNSGVSVGGGVDLGQWDREGLKKAGVDQSTIQKVRPYLGLQTTKAQQKLNSAPLSLDREEAETLTQKIQQKAVKDVSAAYNEDSEFSWDDLNSDQKTAILSVAFQYGTSGIQKQDFWKQVTTQDWEAATNNLRNWGDYQERRDKEAALVANDQQLSQEE